MELYSKKYKKRNMKEIKRMKGFNKPIWNEIC